MRFTLLITLLLSMVVLNGAGCRQDNKDRGTNGTKTLPSQPPEYDAPPRQPTN
jgi:hypothetical protein